MGLSPLSATHVALSPPPFVSLPPDYVVASPDAAWAEDVLTHPSAYHGVTTLHFPDRRALEVTRNPAWQQRVRELTPFRSVREVHGFGVYKYVHACALPMPAFQVVRVHVALSEPGDFDLHVACLRFRALEHLSVCRQVVSHARLKVGLAEAARLDAEQSGKVRSLGPVGEQKALKQGQTIDIARLVYCAVRTVQQEAPPSLLSVQLVFQAFEVADFLDSLHQALAMRIDPVEAKAPLLSECLREAGRHRDRVQELTWHFVWQTRAGGPLRRYTLARGESRSYALHLFADASLPESPFCMSLLSTRRHPSS